MHKVVNLQRLSDGKIIFILNDREADFPSVLDSQTIRRLKKGVGGGEEEVILQRGLCKHMVFSRYVAPKWACEAE